ncbi:MAG: anthranilate phosphoribosyltransferase [Pseudomonadota bacterium]
MSGAALDSRDLLNAVLDGRDLSETDAYSLMYALANAELNDATAGAILAGLRAKGETADEVRGFAMAMRELAITPNIPDGAPMVDTVGTGGDGSGSVNLSTGTGLLAAAAGVRVVKHGNRSISSKSGSADLLECLGMTLPLDEQAEVDCLEALGFTFLFAPAHHPAMKAIMPVRQAMGVRTVFNMLGPLTNPAEPPFSLLGAWSIQAAELMANALTGMAIERVFVVHGEPGWDEATPVGEFVLFDVRDGMVTRTTRAPEDYGVARCQPDDLAGGDAAANADALQRVFAGEDKGAHRDALLMGTSLVLEVCGHAKNAADGMEMAAAAIDDGSAQTLIENLQAHFSS